MDSVKYVVSPRAVTVEDGVTVLGQPLAADVAGGASYADVTLESGVLPTNLSVFSMRLNADQEAAIRADNRFYIVDVDKLRQGDMSGFLAWLSASGVTQQDIADNAPAYNIRDSLIGSAFAALLSQ